MNRSRLARAGAYVAVVAVFVGGLWRVETTATQADAAAHDAKQALDELEAERLAAREAACLKDDERNAIQRRMSRDAPLEVGEAIIEVAGRQGGNPPDPAVIEQLRQVQARRIEGIVNQLPAWEWDPDTETCVVVPLDIGG